MSSIPSPMNRTAQPAPKPAQPARKSAGRGAAFGTKLLIGAVSVAATLGGWAYIALFNPAKPETPDTTVMVTEPDGSMQAIVLPTVAPVVGIDDLPMQQVQVQAQAPVVQRPMRSVNIPTGPLARSHSSR